jgi:hypothetical protein
MDAEINNVIYMELYSGPKMVRDKYGKTKVAGSIDQDSTVCEIYVLLVIESLQFYTNKIICILK